MVGKGRIRGGRDRMVEVCLSSEAAQAKIFGSGVEGGRMIIVVELIWSGRRT